MLAEDRRTIVKSLRHRRLRSSVAVQVDERQEESKREMRKKERTIGAKRNEKVSSATQEARYFSGRSRRLIAKITADTRNRLGTTLATLFTVDTAGWNVCPRGHAGRNIRGQLPPSATYITPHLSGALSFVLANDRGEIFRVARARHPHDSVEADRSFRGPSTRPYRGRFHLHV